MNLLPVNCQFAFADAINTAQGQSSPSKPIRVVVPFPTGGTDVTARIITNKMAELFGRQAV